MYNLGVMGGGAAVVGLPFARNVLPFTGFAFGAYVAVALCLMLAGIVFKLAGRARS